MSIALPDHWEAARPLLLPVIRRATEPANAWRAAREGPDNALITRPVGRMLHTCLVVDTTDLRMFVKPKHLAQWGVSESAAWLQAEANATATEDIQTSDGMWFFRGYEVASCMRSSAWRQTATRTIEGPVVFAAPHPGLIIAAPQSAASDLLICAQAEMHAASVQLCEAIFDTHGHPWLPPEGHPGAGPQTHALAMLTGVVYATQQEQLMEAWDAGDVDMRVPSVAVARGPAGSWTRCDWYPEVAALLPATDRVRVATDAGFVEVPGAELLRAIDAKPAPGVHPARFEIPPIPAVDVAEVLTNL